MWFIINIVLYNESDVGGTYKFIYTRPQFYLIEQYYVGPTKDTIAYLHICVLN